MSIIKFKISDVLPQVAQVAQVVNQKNTISILENVVFETFNQGFVNITASDGETWLLVSAKVESYDNDVKCCFNAQRLNTALKSLNNETIVEVDFNESSHIARFEYPNGNFELPFLDADEFPCPSKIDDSQDKTFTFTFDLSSKHFVNGLGLTEFATDTDSLYPQFNGIHIDFKKNESNGKSQIVFVSTDTRKLVRYSEDLDIYFEELHGKGFTLPKKAATTILQILSMFNENVCCTIKFDEQSFTLYNESAKLSTRIISGRYPNYDAVIPTNQDKMAIIGRESLIGSLRRVMAFANQKTMMATLTFENNKITLDTKDIDYNTAAQEVLDCTYDGEPITIGFPCNGLIDVVKNVRCESVAIKMSDPTKAGLIIPSSQPVGTEYVSIQMPMQVS